jgi:hypothetical protein
MQSFINEMNIVDRVVAPCPPFFKKIRNAALIIGGIATAVLTAPVSLPALAITVAGYLATASAVAVTVSQCTVDGDKLP